MLNKKEELFLQECEESRVRDPKFVHEENSLWLRLSQTEEELTTLCEALEEFLYTNKDLDLEGLEDILEVLKEVHAK
jgi:hypothetical protein